MSKPLTREARAKMLSRKRQARDEVNQKGVEAGELCPTCFSEILASGICLGYLKAAIHSANPVYDKVKQREQHPTLLVPEKYLWVFFDDGSAFSDEQKEVLEKKDNSILLSGPSGPGKSACALLWGGLRGMDSHLAAESNYSMYPKIAHFSDKSLYGKLTTDVAAAALAPLILLWDEYCDELVYAENSRKRLRSFSEDREDGPYMFQAYITNQEEKYLETIFGTSMASRLQLSQVSFSGKDRRGGDSIIKPTREQLKKLGV